MKFSLLGAFFFVGGVLLIKAVLCDLDGTLVNSLCDLADAANYALETQGYPTHETNKYKYFVGYYSDEVFDNKEYTSTSIRTTDVFKSGFVNGTTVTAFDVDVAVG